MKTSNRAVTGGGERTPTHQRVLDEVSWTSGRHRFVEEHIKFIHGGEGSSLILHLWRPRRAEPGLAGRIPGGGGVLGVRASHA